MATKNTTVATLERSEYGNPQPTITVAYGQARETRARLHELAAAIERRTADNEGWIVVIVHDRCRIHLELADASDAEAARGMKLLRGLVNYCR